MSVFVPVLLVNLYCRMFDCEASLNPPYFEVLQQKSFSPRIISEYETQMFSERLGMRESSEFPEHPLVMTNSGAVQGYTMTISPTRKVYAFQGVPYGEPPIPFSNPERRRPWKGILKAQSESQYCIQLGLGTAGMIGGQEDCLLLDVYTPRGPRGGGGGGGDGGNDLTKFPVIIWVVGGISIFGRSRAYGPANLLREDVILVIPNFRMGVFGYAATGDEHCPGNWAMKDLALSIEWVHENIEQFGGDKTKIVVSGISSGAAAAHMMLYTKHKAREHVSGVISVSGVPFININVDPEGKVIEATKMLASVFGCTRNQSREMIDCLRRVDPYWLAARQNVVWKTKPGLTHMWRAVVEPNHPTAFLTELPEESYANGRVSKVPLIVTRNVNEFAPFGLFLRPIWPSIQQNWFEQMGEFFKLGYRRYPTKVWPPAEQRRSLEELNQLYFNRTNPPQEIWSKQNFKNLVEMMSDVAYNAPYWKAIQAHHKVAPTYAYINKHAALRNTGSFLDVGIALSIDSNFGSFHTSDITLLLNASRMSRPFKEGSEMKTASNNLVNVVANFAKYGKPLYRAENGDLHDVWKPIEDIREPRVLEVGLVQDIRIIRDPLVGTRRFEIWDEIRI